VFDDPQVQIRYIANDRNLSDTVPEQHPFAPLPPKPEVFHAAQTVATKMWPGTPLLPTTASGASDTVYTGAVGLPTYGVSGIDTERKDHREHGRDERVRVASFFRGVQFYYDFLNS
jgi:acetylornithine deacetylase/succinyl-diaminopimelate desuccinylase-like protein